MNLFMSTVFIAGFLSFFAPCTFPLIPVYVGILTDSEGQKHKKLVPFIKTFLFVAGLSTTFVTLGFGAGILGGLIQLDGFYIFGGALVILMGLHQMGILRFKFLEKYKTMRYKERTTNKYLTAYLLGFTFSFAWTPCVGPVLGAVLVVVADGGQALYGGWLMFLYTLGLALPFVMMAALSTLMLKTFERMEKHLGLIKRIGGFLIVIMGVLLMTRNMQAVTIWLERLF